MRKEEGASSRCRPGAIRTARSHLAGQAGPGQVEPGQVEASPRPWALFWILQPIRTLLLWGHNPSFKYSHSLEPHASRRHLYVPRCRDRRGSHAPLGRRVGVQVLPPLLKGCSFNINSQAWLLKSLPSHSRGDKTVCPQAERSTWEPQRPLLPVCIKCTPGTIQNPGPALLAAQDRGTLEYTSAQSTARSP